MFRCCQEVGLCVHVCVMVVTDLAPYRQHFLFQQLVPLSFFAQCFGFLCSLPSLCIRFSLPLSSKPKCGLTCLLYTCVCVCV